VSSLVFAKKAKAAAFKENLNRSHCGNEDILLKKVDENPP
jgi:hypothetical protein